MLRCSATIKSGAQCKNKRNGECATLGNDPATGESLGSCGIARHVAQIRARVVAVGAPAPSTRGATISAITAGLKKTTIAVPLRGPATPPPLRQGTDNVVASTGVSPSKARAFLDDPANQTAGQRDEAKAIRALWVEAQAAVEGSSTWQFAPLRTSSWRALDDAANASLTAAYASTHGSNEVEVLVAGARCVALLRQMKLLRISDGSFMRLRNTAGWAAPALTPLHWAPQREDEARLVEVPSESAEFKWAAAAMELRNPSAVVERVERVQDVALYERYDVQRRQRAEQNGGDANERWLFHGTGNAAPRLIWHDGDVGFDARFSSGVFFGDRAAYFSESAHYSDRGYAHMLCCGQSRGNCACSRGSRGPSQMFLASVICGKSRDYGDCTDGSLARPPALPDSSGKLFASVTSTAAGPDHRMWVVWDNDQAYPRYLITYTSDPTATNPSDRSVKALGTLRNLEALAEIGEFKTVRNAVVRHADDLANAVLVHELKYADGR